MGRTESKGLFLQLRVQSRFGHGANGMAAGPEMILAHFEGAESQPQIARIGGWPEDPIHFDGYLHFLISDYFIR